jgi:hypothetical protein
LMKVFNGKQAAEDYMSSHTLAFSTPELTLMRVPDPSNKENSMPRLMTFIEEKDFEPVQIIDDEKYEPTGAVRTSGMYGNTAPQTSSDTKFCSECGGKIATVAKFCTECGATQD